jgi:Flp pilus assembly protein TadD
LAREIAEARHQEPTHLQAQAVARWLLNQPGDLAAARLAVQKQPTDWMAWVLLADALQNRNLVEAQRTAIDNALAFAAEDASVALSLSSHTKLSPTPAPTDPAHH